MDKIKLMKLVEGLVGPALIGVIGYATTQLKDMSHSIQELNLNMAVVIKTLQVQDKSIETHSVEIRNLKEDLEDLKYGR